MQVWPWNPGKGMGVFASGCKGPAQRTLCSPALGTEGGRPLSLPWGLWARGAESLRGFLGLGTPTPPPRAGGCTPATWAAPWSSGAPVAVPPGRGAGCPPPPSLRTPCFWGAGSPRPRRGSSCHTPPEGHGARSGPPDDSSGSRLRAGATRSQQVRAAGRCLPSTCCPLSPPERRPPHPQIDCSPLA